MELEIITSALRRLGERAHKRAHNIKIKVNGDVAVVYIHDEYYGIWSFPRNTFVD